MFPPASQCRICGASLDQGDPTAGTCGPCASIVAAESSIIDEIKGRASLGVVASLSLACAVFADLFTDGPYHMGTGADSGWFLLWCITCTISMVGPASAVLLLRDYSLLVGLEFVRAPKAAGLMLLSVAVMHTVVGALAVAAWTGFLYPDSVLDIW